MTNWMLQVPTRLVNLAWRQLNLPRFASVGTGCTVYKGDFTYETITLGNHVYIGESCRFWAVHSRIFVGNKVVFGPEVGIMAGDHDFTKPGAYIADIGDGKKSVDCDRDVKIEDDVWVGTRTVILKGVHIGRGSVIGAGSVVAKDVPPYAVAVGNPARVKSFRWPIDVILEHEKVLYPEHLRLPRSSLESAMSLAQVRHSRFSAL